jgi:cytochrome oxidase Cu insertion factor (SCO1/SenC/PrrC family)
MNETIATHRTFGVGMAALVLAGAVGTGVWLWQARQPGNVGGDDRPLEGLRVLGSVPDFSLIERGGRQITRADLQGRVWIANFIYTHCTDTCPLQSARMARLQADFSAEGGVRLVSFTVDPEQDTPQVLAEYATRFGADRERWLFLTGEKNDLYALARDGFHLSVADPGDTARPSPEQHRTDQKRQTRRLETDRAPATRNLSSARWNLLEPVPAFAHPGHAGKPFLHSSRFVLVDPQARIRGYYESLDEGALQRLRRDVKALLREVRP